MELKIITRILRLSSLSGAEKHLSCVFFKDRISKAEAYRLYGRSAVDRWISEGLIIPNGKKLDARKLNGVARASNRITYLTSCER